jgi:hypothetical protein
MRRKIRRGKDENRRDDWEEKKGVDGIEERKIELKKGRGERKERRGIS